MVIQVTTRGIGVIKPPNSIKRFSYINNHPISNQSWLDYMAEAEKFRAVNILGEDLNIGEYVVHPEWQYYSDITYNWYHTSDIKYHVRLGHKARFVLVKDKVFITKFRYCEFCKIELDDTEITRCKWCTDNKMPITDRRCKTCRLTLKQDNPDEHCGYCKGKLEENKIQDRVSIID